MDKLDCPRLPSYCDHVRRRLCFLEVLAHRIAQQQQLALLLVNLQQRESTALYHRHSVNTWVIVWRLDGTVWAHWSRALAIECKQRTHTIWFWIKRQHFKPCTLCPALLLVHATRKSLVQACKTFFFFLRLALHNRVHPNHCILLCCFFSQL